MKSIMTFTFSLSCRLLCLKEDWPNTVNVHEKFLLTHNPQRVSAVMQVSVASCLVKENIPPRFEKISYIGFYRLFFKFVKISHF